MSNLIFGTRVGDLDEIDYDLGVFETLGAVLDPVKNQYYLPLTDAQGRGIYIQPPGSNAPEPIDRALVVMKQSEPTHTEQDLPLIVVQREDFSFAENREWSTTIGYRIPAPGAKPVAVGNQIGYTAYETKEKPWPVDFTYSIECWARERVVAMMLRGMVIRAFPPRGAVRVKDAIGNERVYHAYFEGTSDLTAVNSLVERIAGYSVSVRIEGELTWDRVAQILPAFTGTTRPQADGPFDPNSPDPGPSGLYGDGRACIRATTERG